MKIIWNDEPTAPEAPFFAVPVIKEETPEPPVEEKDDAQ
jgi:hypothetical protein